MLWSGLDHRHRSFCMSQGWLGEKKRILIIWFYLWQVQNHAKLKSILLKHTLIGTKEDQRMGNYQTHVTSGSTERGAPRLLRGAGHLLFFMLEEGIWIFIWTLFFFFKLTLILISRRLCVIGSLTRVLSRCLYSPLKHIKTSSFSYGFHFSLPALV